MRRIRFWAATVACAAALLMLSGCLPTLAIPDALAPESPATGGGTSSPGAPAGWAEFPNCEAGPDVDWVWVDGYPVEAFETAGLMPQCADVWVEADGETFLSVAHYGLTVDDIDALGSGLEQLGYIALVDDFDPAAAPNMYAGARDYYLNGVPDGEFTRFAMEIYVNPIGGKYTAYLDYLSPETRVLG